MLKIPRMKLMAVENCVPRVIRLSRKSLAAVVLTCSFILYMNLYWISIDGNVSRVTARHVVRQSTSLKKLQLNFDVNVITLQIINNGSSSIDGIIGDDLTQFEKIEIQNQSENYLKIFFLPSISLEISSLDLVNRDHNSGKVDCYNIAWTQNSLSDKTFSFQDRYSLEMAYWYGGAVMSESYWPLNNRKYKLSPFVTGDTYTGRYGGIQERFWLSSFGSSIFVDYNIPLFVDINEMFDGWLTLLTKYEKPYGNKNQHPLVLNYTLCVSEDNNPKHTFLTAAGNFWSKPNAIPNEDLFKYPTWSTWAAFKRDISSDVVWKYAEDIRSNGLNCSQLVIDDGWMSHYGDFRFNPRRFPDPRNLFQRLKHQLNISVSLWVHPFASLFSSAFWKCDSRGKSFWIKMFDWLPAQTMWWNGVGTVLDLTNEEAYSWFLEQLRKVVEDYNVNSFKFDAGESTWIPSNSYLEHHFDNPNDYTRTFSDLATKADFRNQKMQEVRSSVSSQHLPIFVRLIDKNSHWGIDNGLASIIPQILTCGIIGYPFVLPDMIGGNSYFGAFIHFSYPPDRELYIRWLQISALMPAMQFSVGPWIYDEEVVRVAQNMCHLHELYSPLIVNLAKEALLTGAPIIRPIWWTANTSSKDERSTGMNNSRTELFTSETEFMLGDHILVAPILVKGAKRRKVYLPRGHWQRGGSDVYLEGNKWHNISVPLDQLAYFIRA